VVVCVAYFAIKNFIKTSKPPSRAIFKNPETGAFDWTILAVIIVTAINELVIFFSIGYNFKLAQQAGLNIGVAQAIWAVNPFFQGLVDTFCYNDILRTYHWVGMAAFVLAGVVVSLSDVVYSDKEESTTVHTTPMYAAVLSSFIMPITAITFGVLAKFAMLKQKLDSNDFNFSYLFVMYTSQLIFSLHYLLTTDEFSTNNFIRGFMGSAINAIGCMFMNYAINTGQPLGPMFALVLLQSFIILIYESIVNLYIPNLMQAAGFVFGITGGLILLIPEEM
jgi:magnesium-transporting ATPase (P-type)